MPPAGKFTGRRQLLDLVVDGAIELGAGGPQLLDLVVGELGAGEARVGQLLDLVVDGGR